MSIDDNLKLIINEVKKIVPLKEAFLFGSFAYGTPNEDSDYDFYFVLDKIDNTTHETLVSITRVLYKVSSRPFDILIDTKESFDYRASNQATLEYKILKDGVKIYG